MKLLPFALVFASLSAAAAAPQDCLQIKNSLDRRYCLDKYLETVKDRFAAEKQGWASGLPADAKASKTSTVEQDIAAKKEWINLMQSEIALTEKHLEALKAAPVAAVAAAPEAAPAPAKKKKKKGGFRIKL